MGSHSDADRYLLIRTKAESERLDTQHEAFRESMGFLLHPAIPQHDHMRPGGYLQWTDIAVLDGVVIPGVLGCNVDDANRFLNQFKQIVSSHGKSGKSVTELFPHFKKCGLKDCRKDIAPLDKPEYKDMLNANYVKAISHILQASLQPSQGCRDALSMDQITRLGKLTLKNLQETNSSLLFSLHVVIGRRE
ncbi:hypothetical protein BDBG_00618 [Blastomyces gilchristii SLH14081]|uniref:Uncharacterized protein n=1 Tax=Blastomyces gilchristii (strain SLH14081) TaxID=559298 RepID=A0A179U8C3_BLAGS|nr:uncharacterized protein BDBG_00618 [Blastomyces gilchristii SLH14081]OAT03973.1 hypothetical protein BDBG_00618 [Blastomyces gilchristii SLH14081]